MVRGRVGNVMRVMVHRGRRRGCRDIAPPCRCLFPPAGIRPCAPLAEGAGAGGGAAPVLYGVSPGPPGLGPGTPTAFPPRWIGCLRPGWRGKRKRGNHRNAAQEMLREEPL